MTKQCEECLVELPLGTFQNKEAALWDSEEFVSLVKKRIFANNL